MANWQPYREPRTFSGNDGDDIDEWLVHYDRVSKFNRWDTAAQRENVVLFLSDTALTWFENHEGKLTNWSRLVEEIKKRFGDSMAKKKRAEHTLLQRAQVPGESCTTYIEEVLKLCRTVNSAMSEEDKVGHLLKGIAEDVYTFLISKDSLTTVEDVIQHCQTFAALKTRRIAPKFGRLPNVATVASLDDTQAMDFSSTVRQIVREELRRHDDLVHCVDTNHASHLLQDASRSAWVDCPPLQSAPLRRTPVDGYPPRDVPPRREWVPAELYPSVNSASFDGHRPSFELSDTHVPWSSSRGGYSRRPDGDYYREDRRGYRSRTQSAMFVQPNRIRPQPVCYHCGIVGHIARFCRRRRETPMQDLVYTTSGPPTRGFESDWPVNNFRPRPQRSVSPAASDRSLTPPAGRQRRSPSPRRRPGSPPPGN